jgi:hypothetical protein
MLLLPLAQAVAPRRGRRHTLVSDDQPEPGG